MHVSVALHAVEQRCVFVLHAEPVGHWLDVLHQHEEMVETHTSPLGLPAHALNALVQAPFMAAPEICIEVASPSDSAREFQEKVAAYLAMGATEAWIVYPQTKRVEFFGAAGPLSRSAFAVNLDSLFD